jgi:uncharacterized protein
VSPAVDLGICGAYEIVAPKDGSLWERSDGALELVAENRYLVRFGPGASRDVLRGALAVPAGGSEGRLRFGNYVGFAELGGRQLFVTSTRLGATAVQGMLDDVAEQLASLPFSAAKPVGAPYERKPGSGPDALYHAFAFLRDRMRDRRLPEAIERILAGPHEALSRGEARLVPTSAASGVDAATLESIQREPELLSPVSADSPVASSGLARRLGGSMPEFVRTRSFVHTTDNPENRFVAGAIDAMTELLRSFERMVEDEARPSAAVNAREARQLTRSLRRWRRHRVFDGIKPVRQPPLQSTVLRSRSGYRGLLSLHGDLLGRTRLAGPHELRHLLELRDSAQIYEHWCFFRVAQALSEQLGRPLKCDRFVAYPLNTAMPYGYRITWQEATLVYNQHFPAAGLNAFQPGVNSYSLPFRPDTVLHTTGGALYVFDAKLKLQASKFKPEDLYKMHTYRDALGARSTWVLYPGTEPESTRFQAQVAGGGFAGVGAIALLPAAEHDGGLATVLAELLAA